MSYRADQPDDRSDPRPADRDARSGGARSNPSEHPDDVLVSQSEEAQRASSAARAFDVRRVIGGLFVVYGVIVTVVGLTDTTDAIDKAQGVRINLWAGLAMLAFGGLMLLWQRLSPAEAPQPQPPAADSAGGSGTGSATEHATGSATESATESAGGSATSGDRPPTH